MDPFFWKEEDREYCSVWIIDCRTFDQLRRVHECDESIEQLLGDRERVQAFHSSAANDAYFLRKHGIYPHEVY